MEIVLILTVIFVPLILILYYFGFGVTKAGVFILNASYSLPARCKGTLSEVKGPDGSALSPASGSYEQDASLLFDVGRFKCCTVTLRMDHFSGKFRIALQ